MTSGAILYSTSSIPYLYEKSSPNATISTEFVLMAKEKAALLEAAKSQNVCDFVESDSAMDCLGRFASGSPFHRDSGKALLSGRLCKSIEGNREG